MTRTLTAPAKRLTTPALKTLALGGAVAAAAFMAAATPRAMAQTAEPSMGAMHMMQPAPSLNLSAYGEVKACLLYTSPSPRDQRGSRMPSSA